jgi:catechol 2,3-dioxygenase-like lactoylglutathione lyase family enzyme
MIEHVSLRTRDVAKSRKFYEKALAPLGYRVHYAYPDAVGFMAEGHTSFWVTKGRIGTPAHIAFRARSRRVVDAFYRAAMDAGGRDNGGPGLRDYSPTYYAAFVMDRDGNNMEAATFKTVNRRGRGRGRVRAQGRRRGQGRGRPRSTATRD